MVLSIIAFCKYNYVRNLTFQGILGFFLFVGGWSFSIASIRDFDRNIVLLSIICPRNLKRVKKNCDLSGLLSCFRFLLFDDTVLKL